MNLTAERRRDLLARLSADDVSEPDERAVIAAYIDGLPQPEVSRCPFTQVLVRRTVDTFGLDGPWWDVDSVVRPREGEPPTLWAFSGAMRLADAVEDTPFLVKPGPGVPFVVEHLIRHPAVRAVVSTLPVGNHTGYVVCYFADVDGGAPEHLARTNEWGAASYWYEDASGWWSDSVAEGEESLLFDLAPWVADGKLSWIAPGDPALRLQSDVTGCPYLDLEGPQERQRVQSGRAWTPSSVATVAPAADGEAPTPPRRRARTPRSTAPPDEPGARRRRRGST